MARVLNVKPTSRLGVWNNKLSKSTKTPKYSTKLYKITLQILTVFSCCLFIVCFLITPNPAMQFCLHYIFEELSIILNTPVLSI